MFVLPASELRNGSVKASLIQLGQKFGLLTKRTVRFPGVEQYGLDQDLSILFRIGVEVTDFMHNMLMLLHLLSKIQLRKQKKMNVRTSLMSPPLHKPQNSQTQQLNHQPAFLPDWSFVP